MIPISLNEIGKFLLQYASFSVHSLVLGVCIIGIVIMNLIDNRKKNRNLQGMTLTTQLIMLIILGTIFLLGLLSGFVYVVELITIACIIVSIISYPYNRYSSTKYVIFIIFQILLIILALMYIITSFINPSVFSEI